MPRVHEQWLRYLNPKECRMIDTNANLSRWPFRRLAGDDPADFVARMRKAGVTQSWVSSFDGLLHRDAGGVNARLAADCKEHGNASFVSPREGPPRETSCLDIQRSAAALRNHRVLEPDDDRGSLSFQIGY